MARIKANGRAVGLPSEARAKRLSELEAQLIGRIREAEVEALRLEEDGFNPNRQILGAPEWPYDPSVQARVMLELWGSFGAAEIPPPPSPDSRAERKESRSLSELGRSLNDGVSDGAPGIEEHVVEVSKGHLPRARRK